MNFLKKRDAGEAGSGGSWGPTGNRREGASARRRRLMPLWFAGCLVLGGGSLGAPVATAQTTTLAPAACPTNLGSCTANEVQTSVVLVTPQPSDPTCSGPADFIDVKIDLRWQSNADRYDLGVYVAQDGGSLNGTPAGRPVATVCNGAPASIPPFVNLETTPGDTCGDITGGTTVDWSVITRVSCAPVVNGVLQAGSCRFWDQNKNKTPACTTVASAGTGSKCDCTALSLTPGLAFGTLTVIKQLVPANDPGLFNLTIDGVVNASNVGHNGTTGPVTVSADTHLVGETAGTNTDLFNYDTAISCTNSAGTTVGSNATVIANENTTCTITNTSKAVPVCRMVRLRSSGAVTPPGAALFGTGQLNGTCSGTSCSLAINTSDGMFSGKGLIYNDGQFPVSSGCNAATEECFPTQSNTLPSANPFLTTSPGFNLNGLTLTPGNFGGTITFTGPGTYTFTAGSKFSNHSGTYTTLDCANTVPEPRTLMLMLPLVLILLSWSALGLARRSRARQRSG